MNGQVSKRVVYDNYGWLRPCKQIRKYMTFSDQEKYLCLFAHPDDDVFIGGTLKLLLDQGADL